MDYLTEMEILKKMVLIRKTEEKIAEFYPEQKMKCPVHLSLGQEASAVGVSINLRSEDLVFSNHRCHAHYLAKGGDIKKMIAELYGRTTGCARGNGGSMHLVDPAVGFMGASAIVGGTIPIAVGAALAFVMRGEERVVAVFFGDGAAEEGVLYESLNFASLKKLPILFICENNRMAVDSPFDTRQAVDNIWRRGKMFGVQGFRIDGGDVRDVFVHAQNAVSECVHGNGPMLLECRVERWAAHVGPSYIRSSNCPIQKLEKELILENAISSDELENIHADIDKIVSKYFLDAREGSCPVLETKGE